MWMLVVWVVTVNGYVWRVGMVGGISVLYILTLFLGENESGFLHRVLRIFF